MYALGAGVAQDDAAAREWLDKSAAQGFSVALFTLDVFYNDKINGPRVPTEIVPRVEQFVKDLAKMAGSESPE
jgi:TPR repeat protein